MRYFIGIGSNQGNREENLLLARKHICSVGLELINQSACYETEPVGSVPQPWFLNQVVEIESCMAPQEMLSLLLGIEKRMGRKRTVPKGPRCIDLDILLAGDTVIREEKLTVPHKELAHRKFVLIPLLEIAAEVRHPVSGFTVRELISVCRDDSHVVKRFNRC